MSAAVQQSKVQFIDQPIQLSQDLIDSKHECPICMDSDKRDYYIIHEGNSGEKHPLHFGCVKEWITKNSTCPVCRVPISNTLLSRKEKITALSRDAARAGALGAEELNHEYVHGASVVSSIAGLCLGGLSGFRNAFSVFGMTYGCAWLGNAGAVLLGKRSEDVIDLTRLFAGAGALVALIAWYTGHIEDSKLVELSALITLSKAAGFAPTALGATIGGVSAFALQWFGMDGAYPAGAALAILSTKNLFQINPAISLIGAITGGSVAYAANAFGPTLAATFGGMASVITTSVLNKAYLKFRAA